MRRALLAALGLVLVVEGCGSGDGSSLAAARAAQRSARSAAVHLTTYDYRTLERDFGWAEQGGTSRFRSDYADASAPVRQVVRAGRVSAKGAVVASAPDYVDATHVRVLLFVDQTLDRPGLAQADLEQLRVRMSMVLRHGDWLVDRVEVLNRSTGDAGGQARPAG